MGPAAAGKGNRNVLDQTKERPYSPGSRRSLTAVRSGVHGARPRPGARQLRYVFSPIVPYGRSFAGRHRILA
jgi:hypothetical protein